MISIIVPIYNVQDYLDRCIKSLVNQTFKDIEIILIDDGSTDNSSEICLKWKEEDNRIIYIKKENEGQGIARNLGVKISKGEYLMFVDSDDWIEKDTVELMYRAEKESKADIIVSDICNVYKNNNGELSFKISSLRMKSNVVINVKENIRLIDTVRLFYWGKLYKRDFYVNSKVNQPGYAFEDSATLPLLISKANTIYRIPKALYNYYRGRSNNTVNNISRYGDMIKSLKEIERGFKKGGVFEKYYTVLRKISYLQVRFVYRKLMAAGRKVFLDNKRIIKELYEFMDKVYPDWIDIDSYNIGFIGGKVLKEAILNIVFDNSRIEDCKDNFDNLINKDILILNLVYDLLYKNSEVWCSKLRDDLIYLQKNFNGKQIIIVKFISEKLRDRKEIVDKIYDEYEKSDLNISIINFYVKDEVYIENISWDLSDEILNKLSD